MLGAAQPLPLPAARHHPGHPVMFRNWFAKTDPRRPGTATWTRLGVEALEPRDTPALNPTGVEQELLEHINRMRTNPAAELGILTSSLNPIASPDADVTAALRFFRVDGALLQQQWAALTPAAPLAWNEALTTAARGHSDLLVANDSQSHQEPGEPGLGTRATNAGYAGWTALAENVFSYAESAFYTHAGFAIDWGSGPGGIQSPAGHRVNMMSASYREIGIAVVAETNPATSVGPLVVTKDFGNRSNIGNPFVLGVAYRDADQNGRYTAGEGLSGVTVTVSGAAGTFTTTTLAAGGYQLQAPAGAYTVTFSGTGLSTPITSAITVGTQNVKADAAAPLFVNQAPTGLQLSAATIPENRPAGTTVGTLTATDPNAQDTHTFSLVAGAGDADNRSFEVVNGNVLRARTPFDFEARSGYTVRLQVRDAAGSTFARSVAVTVTNVVDGDQTGITVDGRRLIRRTDGRVFAVSGTDAYPLSTVTDHRGASWFVGPDLQNGVPRVYRWSAGTGPVALGVGNNLGRTLDGRVVVDWYGRGVSFHDGTRWVPLTNAYDARARATWFVGPDLQSGVPRVYKWPTGAAPVALGVGNNLGRTLDGRVVVDWYGRGVTFHDGVRWVSLSSVYDAPTRTTYFVGPDLATAVDRRVYRWRTGGTPTDALRPGVFVSLQPGTGRPLVRTAAGTLFAWSGSFWMGV